MAGIPSQITPFSYHQTKPASKMKWLNILANLPIYSKEIHMNCELLKFGYDLAMLLALNICILSMRKSALKTSRGNRNLAKIFDNSSSSNLP